MKVVTKNEAAKGAATETSYSVSAASVAGVAGIIGTILSVAQVLTSLILSLVDIPRRRAEAELTKAETELAIKMVEDYSRIQLLHRVLNDSNEKDRANSIKLLLAAGLLNDPEGKIGRLADTPSNVPHWEDRSLENLGDILSALRGVRREQRPGNANSGGAGSVNPPTGNSNKSGPLPNP
jgi:histidyl-tRNA synthetase